MNEEDRKRLRMIQKYCWGPIKNVGACAIDTSWLIEKVNGLDAENTKTAEIVLAEYERADKAEADLAMQKNINKQLREDLLASGRVQEFLCSLTRTAASDIANLRAERDGAIRSCADMMEKLRRLKELVFGDEVREKVLSRFDRAALYTEVRQNILKDFQQALLNAWEKP